MLRIVVLILLFSLGMGVLDGTNTYGMRMAALITMLLLWGTFVAWFFIEKQLRMAKGFAEELEKIKKEVTEIDQAKDKLVAAVREYKSGRSET